MSNRDREDPRETRQGAALEDAWRNVSTEQPSARLDAAILAAARQAVADRSKTSAATPARVPPRQRWSQWAPMAAAAAVAGLALTLVQTLPRDPDQAPTPAVPESPAATAPASAPTPVPTQPGSAERHGVEAPRSSDRDSPIAQEQAAPPRAMAAPTDIPASPVAIPAENTAGAIAAASQAPSVGSNESRSDLSVERGKALESAVSAQAEDADEWVARIRALHAAGDIAAAEDALRAFRATEPDADRHLPQSLREWAALVR